MRGSFNLELVRNSVYISDFQKCEQQGISLPQSNFLKHNCNCHNQNGEQF